MVVVLYPNKRHPSSPLCLLRMARRLSAWHRKELCTWFIIPTYCDTVFFASNVVIPQLSNLAVLSAHIRRAGCFVVYLCASC